MKFATEEELALAERMADSLGRDRNVGIHNLVAAHREAVARNAKLERVAEAARVFHRYNAPRNSVPSIQRSYDQLKAAIKDLDE